MSKLNVAVIFGGCSSEYEVSLMSAASVLENMPGDFCDCIRIGITRDGRWYCTDASFDEIKNDTWLEKNCVPCFLSPDRGMRAVVKLLPDGSYETCGVDVVFPVLHGKNGEDGTIQGLFELAGIPYVGCDVLSSAVCMDKVVTNMLLERFGVKRAAWGLITKNEFESFEKYAENWEAVFGYPMFVKPANAGSSVGISKAKSRAELRMAVELAFDYDRKVIVEREIKGKEIECAVLGNTSPVASVVGEIVPSNEFYDYEAKYVSGTSSQFIPARVGENVQNDIRAIAIKSYRALGCAGLARVDFLYEDTTGEIYLNELNTIPGFTSISMYPKLFDASGIKYPELLKRLIELAISRNEGKND